MSDAAQFATTSRTEAADASSPQPGGLPPLLIAALGGLITGALLIGAVSLVHRALPDALTLQSVARHDIDEAALSLDSAVSRQVADEARQCKTPMAFVTMALAPGQPPASVRIRSGSYLSPPIRITDSPRRIAVPFPAPYPTGKGMLSVEGSARSLNVWLSPGRHYDTLNGAEQIPVVWTPKDPC